MNPQQSAQGPDTGMYMRDLLQDAEFRSRPYRQRMPWHSGERAFQRLAQLIGSDSRSILQELVEIAVEFTEADSSGISLEEPSANGEQSFRWIAIAGTFAEYVNGTTPRFFSPCGTTLEKNRPQLYRVTQAYYDVLGVKAQPILDGILIPWEIEGTRGTIWAVSHKAPRVFDFCDYELLDSVADFVAIAMRQQKQLRLTQLSETEGASELAGELYDPLLSVKNALARAKEAEDPRPYVEAASREVDRVEAILKRLLKIRSSAQAASRG
jgi:hypothetical protein